MRVAAPVDTCPFFWIRDILYSESINHKACLHVHVCMDAMEHICPEDWPLILNNFHQALKPQGYFYFTVELAPGEEVEEAFQKARQQDLPVIYGEWENTDVYNYYPSMEQVREWLQQAGFSMVEEGEGDGYHHFISQKA